MKTIDLFQAIEIIAENEWTILVIDASGLIREAIPFDSLPPIQWGYKNQSRIKGCGVKYVPRGKLTMAELESTIHEVVDAILLFKDYEQDSKDEG